MYIYDTMRTVVKSGETVRIDNPIVNSGGSQVSHKPKSVSSSSMTFKIPNPTINTVSSFCVGYDVSFKFTPANNNTDKLYVDTDKLYDGCSGCISSIKYSKC